jgi:hypothetical protein
MSLPNTPHSEEKQPGFPRKETCPVCARRVSVDQHGDFVTHGPFEDKMTCPGSGKATSPNQEEVKGQ